ncbi:hypothetical protein D032_2664B, partial [Vibrio parahaemolyticus V14/01]
LGSLAYQPLPL